jgi:multiple sugar transport system substrate-binding protein
MSHSSAAPVQISRRRMLSYAGAALGGLTAAACTPETTKPSASGGKKQISILDDNTNALFKKSVIADFEKKTGIEVVRYEQLNFNDLHDRLATLFAARDSSYDVVMTWAAWSAEFGQAGWLEPIDKADVPDDLNQSALDAVSWNGQAFGLPKFASVQTMFYNKTLFEAAGVDPDAPPTSWPEFLAVLEKTTGSGRFGFTCDMGNADGAYQNFLRTLLGNGGAMYDDQNRPTFADAAGVDALKRLAGLRNTSKLMAPTSLQITHSDDLSTFFVNGQTAVVFNWPFQYARAMAKGSTLTKQTLGNAIIPGIKVRSASIDGSEGFAISKFSKNKGPALEWLKFVTTPAVQRTMVLREGWLPVSTTVLKDEQIVQALPVVETYAEQSKYTIRRYGAPWYNEVVEDLSAGITKAMLGQVEPAEALESSAAKAQQIIDKHS